MVGSHLDGVLSGGKYDGVDGVLGGLGILSGLAKSGQRPQHNLVVTAWRAEESPTFKFVSPGAKLALGLLAADKLQSLKSIVQHPFPETALIDIIAKTINEQINGGWLSRDDLKTASDKERKEKLTSELTAHAKNSQSLLPHEQILGSVEFHIDQISGDVSPLKQADALLGLITAIRGNLRWPDAHIPSRTETINFAAGTKKLSFSSIDFKGETGHTGAVPQDNRKDAVYDVAKFLSFLKDLAKRHDAQISIAELTTYNNSPTAIPDHFTLKNVSIYLPNHVNISDIQKELFAFATALNSFVHIDNAYVKNQAGLFNINTGWKAFLDFTQSWTDYLEDLRQFGSDLVHTIPVVHSNRNGTNFALEVRSDDDALMKNEIRPAICEIASDCKVRIDLNGRASFTKAARMDEIMLQWMENVASDLGLSAARMRSGPGHDSALPPQRNIPTSLVFFPLASGASHHPSEQHNLEDVKRTFEFGAEYIMKLDQQLSHDGKFSSFTKALKQKGALEFKLINVGLNL